jgi:hypothetical protein
MPKHVTVDLSGEALATVRSLAARRGQTIGRVIAEAIATEQAVSAEVAAGGVILLHQPGRGYRQLLMDRR